MSCSITKHLPMQLHNATVTVGGKSLQLPAPPAYSAERAVVDYIATQFNNYVTQRCKAMEALRLHGRTPSMLYARQIASLRQQADKCRGRKLIIVCKTIVWCEPIIIATLPGPNSHQASWIEKMTTIIDWCRCYINWDNSKIGSNPE